MEIRIPQMQSALNFFMNATFIYYCLLKYLNVATFSKVSLATFIIFFPL
jgi:hypothetical protein